MKVVFCKAFNQLDQDEQYFILAFIDYIEREHKYGIVIVKPRIIKENITLGEINNLCPNGLNIVKSLNFKEWIVFGPSDVVGYAKIAISNKLAFMVSDSHYDAMNEDYVKQMSNQKMQLAASKSSSFLSVSLPQTLRSPTHVYYDSAKRRLLQQDTRRPRLGAFDSERQSGSRNDKSSPIGSECYETKDHRTQPVDEKLGPECFPGSDFP